MVFVTVGTHEQQFDRLVRAIDDLVADDAIDGRVFMQTGYCAYEPEHCEWSKFLPAERMAELMREADVVVTHGGPSSFMEAMGAGKVPVVVPRRAAFGEHVNDHQADFVRAVAERQGGIVPCYDTDDLLDAIGQARAAMGGAFRSHNAEFCDGLASILEGL